MEILEKIKLTKLFTNAEKVELLTALSTFTQDSLVQLESVIDEYDESILDIKKEFANEISQEFDDLISNTTKQHEKDALSMIKSGYSKILQ